MIAGQIGQLVERIDAATAALKAAAEAAGPPAPRPRDSPRRRQPAAAATRPAA